MGKVPLPAGLSKHVSPHGRITAVSMMKDEGPFVLEWVAHHLAVGFTDLVVYTNDCSDGTDTMLMRLEAMGLAHHRVNAIPEGLRPQPSALNYAQDEPVVQESDWVMVFDADEFLSIRHGDGTLDPMISDAKAQGANGIVITWRIFGSGGVQHWSRDPVTEQYLMAAPPDWNKGWGVKTLFQFDADYWKLGIHRPKMKSKWLETDFPASVKWLNGSGREMESYFKFRGWRSITRTIGYDWAQLNHYAVKSIDSYAIRKFRGNVNNKKDKYNADYWSLQDRNEVRDDTMLRYSVERKRIFDALLTDPELNRLHFAAVDRAEARLAEFKGTPAYDELVSGLKAASEVPISAVEAKPPQARDPEKIAALMSRVEKTSNAKAREERLAEPPPPPPTPYVVTGVDLTEPLDVAWFESHGIAVPADPRVFSATGLELVCAGKLERNLARNLPRMVEGNALHLEIGGVGFMPVRLMCEVPALSQIVVEPDANRRAFIRALWAKNGVEEGPRLRLLDSPATPEALAVLLLEHRPQSVLITDPDGPIPLLHQALHIAARTGGFTLPRVFHHTPQPSPNI